MTLIGAIFGILAGQRRTAPFLMAAQLFGVCLLALCFITFGFMVFCQIVDSQDLEGESTNARASGLGQGRPEGGTPSAKWRGPGPKGGPG